MVMTGQIPDREIIDIKCNVLLLSHPTVPGEPPENVRASPHSTTSIKVEWGPVPECDRNGEITSYVVEVFNLTNELEDKLVNVTGSKSFAVIEGLQEYTNYSVKVFAATAKGEGPSSEYKNTTTHQPGSYKENNFFIAGE